MVKPSEVPATVPEMEELTAQQEADIEAFLAKLDERYKGKMPPYIAREHTKERRRIFGYKALKARKWKIGHALKMVEKTVAFREQHGIDQWKLFPSSFPLRGFDEQELCSMLRELPHGKHLYPREGVSDVERCYRALQTSYVNVYHYWDKSGHPVLYDCCGHANVAEILRDLAGITPVGKSLLDVIVPYHMYMNEVQYYLIQYADKVSKEGGGQAIMGVTVIINMEGLSFKVVQRRYIQILRAIFEVDQAHYPEMLHRLLIINAPSFFRIVYDWLKGSLDEGTRSKLVLSSNKEEGVQILRRFIDDDKIPRELGGACDCEGGCLPRYTKHKDDDQGGTSELSSQIGESDAATEVVGIKRGKQFVQTYELQSGDQLTWEFAVDGMREVHFSALFSPYAEKQASRSSLCCTGDAESAATPTTTPATHSKTVKVHNFNHSSTGAAALTLKDEKLSMDADSFQPAEAGMLTLTWSNKGSWMQGRQVQYRVLHHKYSTW
ncbi:hypothetical protein LSCM1_01771 [Leishmania martiniquensis]|uniref:CRAL-TRIO domain-containing protein n=1 Tax=Leishmania martiniquensis TaxID=1580590 RepID=A0A836KFA9_9TRYP|nr:hypothetical protein LSCM1_01771 [Leishmania martiniquensis]